MFTKLTPEMYVRFRAEQMALTEDTAGFQAVHMARGLSFRTDNYGAADAAYQGFIEPYRVRATAELKQATDAARTTFEANLAGNTQDGSHDAAPLTDDEKALFDSMDL